MAKKTTKKTVKKRGRPKKTEKGKVKKPKLEKPKKIKKEKVQKPKLARPERYFEAVGRRKTSVARVRIFTKGEKVFLVNERPFDIYFPTLELQRIVTDSLKKMKLTEKFRVSVRVKGGGVHSQAEAIRHGLARALVLFNPDFRKRLKRVGFLTRDPRMKERKKFGLKRARRAPQWQKR